MKIYNDIEQGSDEWLQIRLGKPTASNFFKIISPTGKESTQADKYMNELIAERIRGERYEKFKSTSSMERGKELEEDAAQAYGLLRGVEPVRVGFVTNDEGTAGCSPDRFVFEDGILEVKTPDPDNHVEHMLKEKLEQEHRPQTQGQLWLCQKKWADTMCNNPKMVPVIMRSIRDDSYISDMERLVNQFLARMNEKIETLKKKGYM